MIYITVSEVIIYLLCMGKKLQRNSVGCLQFTDELNSFLGFHDAAPIFLVTCPLSPSLASLFLLLPYPLPSFLLLVHVFT